MIGWILLGVFVWFFGFSLVALAVAVVTGSWRFYAVRGPVLVVSASKPLRVVTQFFTRFEPRCFTWQCVMFTWDDLVDRNPSDMHIVRYVNAMEATQVGWTPRAHADKATVRHELVHTKQSLVFGLAWPLVYLGASVVARLRGGHWYQDNWFELQAKRAEVEL